MASCRFLGLSGVHDIVLTNLLLCLCCCAWSVQSDESGVAGGASEAAAAERPISSHSGGGGGDEADSSAGGGGRSSEQGTHDAGTHTGHAAGSRGWHTPTPAPAPAQAAPRPGYVACPICGISTRAAFVNAHLDICISRQGQQENVQPSGRGLQPATQKPITNKPKALPAATQQRAGGRDATAHKPGASAAAALPKAPAIDVPPKLVFNLISDKDLRKRMQTLGLPLDGKKQVGGRGRAGQGLIMTARLGFRSIVLQMAVDVLSYTGSHLT